MSRAVEAKQSFHIQGTIIRTVVWLECKEREGLVEARSERALQAAEEPGLQGSHDPLLGHTQDSAQ